MKRFSEQLHKKAMTVKLRAAERKELRERVVSYMEYHPLPAEMKKRAVKEPKLMTEEYKSVSIPFKMLSRWAVGLAAVVIVAVPFMAERSVPGDGLYAVKRFNEDVRGTLAFNTIQKVEWETELLNRRISEARLLKSEGRLTDEVEAEVAKAVLHHSENAQKNIEALRAEDADEATLASLALETTLTVQSAALSDEPETVVSESGEEASSATKPSALAAAVEESRVKTNATNEAATIPSFDKVMAKVEQNTTRVYELRGSLSDAVSEEQTSNITRRLEDIERSIVEAIALRVEDEELAKEALVDSLQRTQKLIVFMTDIDVSQNVDIEEIVPVVLTHQEEKEVLAEYETELNNKLAVINEALPRAEEELQEKATVVLAEIDVRLAEISTSTDFAAAESVVLSALDLANNIFVLLELEELTTPEAPEFPVETGTSTEEVATSTEEVIEEEEQPEEEPVEDEETEVESPEEELPEETVEPIATTTDISTGQVDEEPQI